jgi:SSS family solute:Na+ symporter
MSSGLPAMSIWDVGIVILYMVGIIGLGWAVSRRITTFRDYFVAGGRMTAPLLICTLVSTYYGLDVLLGSSEVAYQAGIVAWFAYARPYYIVILVAAFTIARRLRRYDFLSVPDIGAHFYGVGTQRVLAVASFLYSLPILGFMGLGIVMDVTLGIPFVWGVLLGALVAVVYTILGGLLADALTDTVQFTLMCVTLGVATVIAVNSAGGVDVLRDRLAPSFFEPTGSYPIWVLVVFAGAALSALVEPAFYQRIFAAVNYRAIVVALLVGIVLWAAFDWAVAIVGMVARAEGIETEARYALLTMTMQSLPVGAKGVFVASVLATSMSTVDSYLLIAGGNLSYDLLRPAIRRPMGDRALLRLTRWMIGVAAVVTIVLALFFQTVVSAWIFMSTSLIAAALVPIVGGLYFGRFATPTAGLAASTMGLAVALGYYVLVHTFGAFDPQWETQIWTVRAGRLTLELWQEYALLFALPASAGSFALGALVGRKRG